MASLTQGSFRGGLESVPTIVFGPPSPALIFLAPPQGPGYSLIRAYPVSPAAGPRDERAGPEAENAAPPTSPFREPDAGLKTWGRQACRSIAKSEALSTIALAAPFCFSPPLNAAASHHLFQPRTSPKKQESSPCRPLFSGRGRARPPR